MRSKHHYTSGHRNETRQSPVDSRADAKAKGIGLWGPRRWHYSRCNFPHNNMKNMHGCSWLLYTTAYKTYKGLATHTHTLVCGQLLNHGPERAPLEGSQTTVSLWGHQGLIIFHEFPKAACSDWYLCSSRCGGHQFSKRSHWGKNNLEDIGR